MKQRNKKDFLHFRVEVRWNNIKGCVLDTVSDLVGKVKKRARKPRITGEMISKMDERRKWKNVNTEEGRKNCRRQRNKLKTATDNAKKKNILRTYVTKLWNFKEEGVMI
jgi:hypothetical protein